jgi:tetratricopeptide (TPR) repeat protein
MASELRRAFALLSAVAVVGMAAATAPFAQDAPPPGGHVRQRETPLLEGDEKEEPGVESSELGMYMSKGRHALRAGENGQAAQLFTKVVEMQPDSAAAHFHLGRALFGLYKANSAREEYLKALELDPAHSGAILGLATLDENAGAYESAERRYREAAAKTDSPWPRRSLASLLGRIGRTEEAEKILNELLAADPQDTESRYELGMVRTQDGNCEAAVPEFRKVYEADPHRTEGLYQIGKCLGRMGQTAEAQATLKRYQTEYQKATEEALIAREVPHMIFDADQLAETGDMRGALEKARMAVENAPSSARARAFLGSLLLEAGRNQEALEQLRRATQLDPTDAIALSEVGRLLGLMGRYKEALRYFERAVKVDPDLPPPHQFLAILYQQMGRRQDAARHQAIFEKLMAKLQQ